MIYEIVYKEELGEKIFVYEYNSDNLPVKITKRKRIYGEDYGDITPFTFTYNSNKQLIQKEYNGKVRTKISYNSHGDIEKCEEYDEFEEGNPLSMVRNFTYEYDSHGNWIKRTCSYTTRWGNTGEESVFTREIEYY